MCIDKRDKGKQEKYYGTEGVLYYSIHPDLSIVHRIFKIFDCLFKINIFNFLKVIKISYFYLKLLVFINKIFKKLI